MSKALALILGATSMVGQILLLRELVTVFYGNETAYAVILASWLFWISTGSWAVSRLSGLIRHPRRILTFVLSLIFAALPLSIFLTRIIRPLIGVGIGEMIGIIPMAVSSFLLLAPLTFLLGCCYTLICLVLSPQDDTRAPVTVAGVYLWESVGAVLGGCLYSFLLIHILPAVDIAFMIGILNLVALMILHREGKRRVFQGAVVFLLVMLAAFPLKAVQALDTFSRQWQWKGLHVAAMEDSIYGHLVLTQMGEEYTLYENGIYSYSTKDNLTAEEDVHYALLESPMPRTVLLIGGGLGGTLREILKHAVQHVDYIELDPKVVDISRRNLPRDFLAPLDDPRIRLFYSDARLFVKGTDKRYDVIIVNLPDPHTAMINRYYSLEFFREARDILKGEGILALSVSSSENYLSREIKDFLRSIHTTLGRVFEEVIALPGGNATFIASNRKGILTTDGQELIRRLKERGISTQYVSAHYIPYQFSFDRLFVLKEALKEQGAINTDIHPVGYFFDAVLWSTHFNLTYKKFMEKFAGIQWYHLMLIPIIIFLIGITALKPFKGYALTHSIVITGFSEIVFQVMIIIAFQSLYGFVYYKIGLIMASFMAGLVLGSFFARKMLAGGRTRIYPMYMVIQGCIVLYPFLLPLIFGFFREYSTLENLALFNTIFALLPVVAGFLGGMQYPLATYLRHATVTQTKEAVASAAGALYAADTLGAMIGALATGVVLIPLTGIAATAYLCAALNLAALILLILSPIRPDPYPS